MPEFNQDVEEGLTEQQRLTYLSQVDIHEHCPASHTAPEHESSETKRSVR